MPSKPAKTLNFTKTELAKLPVPETGYVMYHDTMVEGLVLLVYATGGNRFYVYKKLKGKPTRIKLGKFPDMTVEVARKKAQEVLGSIARGDHAAAKGVEEKDEPSLSVGDLFTRYIEEYAVHHCTSWKDTSANFRRYFVDWLDRAVGTINLSDVQQMVNRLGRERGHHTANRAFDDLRAVYSWGKKYGYVSGDNPCAGVTKFKTRSRERFLRPDEFETFFSQLKAERNIDFRDYVYLSLFTGARQANVLSMRWEDIDFNLALWRIPITKNKESQTLPLTNLALQVLVDRHEKRKSDEWVFPSDGITGHLVEPKNAWRKFSSDSGLQDLRLHDLRRTLGSYMAMNNQSLQIIGKVLGHKSAAATQIYARLAFDPLRQAMESAQASLVTSQKLLPDNLVKAGTVVQRKRSRQAKRR